MTPSASATSRGRRPEERSGRGLHLRVESGLLSGIDLAATDSGTTMVVNVLVAVLQFQRELIAESTVEGVAAAVANGKVLGRPSALSEKEAADVVTAYREGAAVKALARQYSTSPRTIRRVLDDAKAREVRKRPPTWRRSAAGTRSVALRPDGAGRWRQVSAGGSAAGARRANTRSA
ncbi:helix-turn-helix domain-containing protein [Streptomyces koyangensis]|uniref:helix-turn-helix domain-containing protein n=1 Tax=Streptomyces koyangensis TaxID=188770 RepID=UPI003C2B8909